MTPGPRTGSRLGPDFYAGLLFLCFGAAAVGFAREYAMGTAARMGPRYFPTVLGIVLIGLGVIITVRALGAPRGRLSPWGIRPLALVLASVVAFAVLVGPFGLVPATVALVAVAAVAGAGFRLREVVALSLVLAALAVGLFVYLLRLPFTIWPR